MAKPELRRLRVREREAPEQPVVQASSEGARRARSAAGAPRRSWPDSPNGRSGGASWRSRRAAGSRRMRRLAASTSSCRAISGGRWATSSSCSLTL
eukprot:1926957-Alexandrium_andersonii.AAC.1